MTVSIGLSGGGLSLTWVGNAAPPIPTMPAARMRSLIASSSRVSGSVSSSTPSAQASSPSLSMTTARVARPRGWGRSSTATTLPDTLAWTGAETNRLGLEGSGSPTTWPIRTASFFFTVGAHGTPMCCDMGSTTSAGAGRGSMALPFDSSLRSCGCTPPGKVFIP